MKKKKLTIFIFAALASAIVLATIFFFIRKKENFNLVPARRGSVVDAIYGLGKVKSHQKYEVKVGLVSTIAQVFVKEGDAVKKGSPLIRFHDSGTFVSPIEGTVTLVNGNVSEAVSPQVPVVAVENLKDLFVEVSLEQESALRVFKDLPVELMFESVRGQKYQGKVVALFPRSEEFLVHIAVDGLSANILPGMTVDVSIRVNEQKDALLIPVAGVQSGWVNLQRNGKKSKVKVELGSIDGMWAQVKSGDVSEGDEILVRKKDAP